MGKRHQEGIRPVLAAPNQHVFAAPAGLSFCFAILLSAFCPSGGAAQTARPPASPVGGQAAAPARTSVQEAPETFRPPKPQPIPFSHKVHAAVGLECLGCHAMKDPGWMAGYPQEGTCMACHASIKTESPHIQKLADFEKQGKPVPWVKVYRVPDYVYFSHEFHYKEAGIGCESCHGPVAEREVIVKEKSVSMNACMACHDKHKAPNDCSLCHDAQ